MVSAPGGLRGFGTKPQRTRPGTLEATNGGGSFLARRPWGQRPPRDPLPKKSSGSVAPIEDRTTEAVSGSTCPGDRVARTKQSKEHANRSVKHRPGERARSPRSTRSVKHEHRGALKHQQSRCTLPIGRGMTKCADASHRATRLRFVMPTPNRPGGKRPRAGALTN